MWIRNRFQGNSGTNTINRPNYSAGNAGGGYKAGYPSKHPAYSRFQNTVASNTFHRSRYHTDKHSVYDVYRV